jgi:hypothetical protein
MAIPGAVELGQVRQLQPLQVLTTLREKTFPEAGDKNQSGVSHFSRAWSPKLALTLSKPRFGLQDFHIPDSFETHPNQSSLIPIV